MEVKALSERWERAARALPGLDRERGRRVAAMAKKHASEAFCAFDDPLEAAVFSVLIEILKNYEEERDGGGADHQDPPHSPEGRVLVDERSG